MIKKTKKIKIKRRINSSHNSIKLSTLDISLSSENIRTRDHLTALICEVFELAATSDKTVETVSIYFITLAPYCHPFRQEN